MSASRWVWSGLAAAACGAVLCAAGWYGVSGERFLERQVPYLASCTVPGAALLVCGAVLAAAGPRSGPRRARERPDAAAFVPVDDGPPLRVPGGTLAHRPDCPLVAGKEGAEPVGEGAAEPCPVCEPWRP
ncbi:hypothetical protein ABT160_45540 [Streptomyces sp. NPDC001941]|uniref:hypothetical protein n=1 Tax=Streptomyces sp. NPDC001941 TaxID=3154659 RepID=UPI003329BA97